MTYDASSKHPAAGTFTVLTSNFGPVVKGHFFKIEDQGLELGPGNFFAIDPKLPQPEPPVPVADFAEKSTSPALLELQGEIEGRRFHMEFFPGPKGARIILARTDDRQGTDVWVAEDDGEDIGGGGG